MKAAIVILGFLLVFGGVGGLENDNEILPCVAIALLGLGMMFYGVKDLQK